MRVAILYLQVFRGCVQKRAVPGWVGPHVTSQRAPELASVGDATLSLPSVLILRFWPPSYCLRPYRKFGVCRRKLKGSACKTGIKDHKTCTIRVTS